jgi:CheY-like chemotaxis protein
VDYRCLFANSGKQALDLMAEEEVAVIVTDMRMPGMDGLHLLRLVRERFPRTVRIVLSGYTQLQQILTTINTAGVFKFITKPWMMDEELKVVLEEALDYYRLQERKDELEIALRKQNESYQNILRKLDVLVETVSHQAAAVGLVAEEALNHYSDRLEAGMLTPRDLRGLGKVLCRHAAHATHDATDRSSTDVSILFRTTLSRNPLVSGVDRVPLRQTHMLRMNVPLMESLAALLPELLPDAYHGGRVRMAFRTETIRQKEYFAAALLFLPAVIEPPPAGQGSPPAAADVPPLPAASMQTIDDAKETESENALPQDALEQTACSLNDDTEACVRLMNQVLDPVMRTMQGRFQAMCTTLGLLFRIFLPMKGEGTETK